jgi:hypothetical protein
MLIFKREKLSTAFRIGAAALLLCHATGALAGALTALDSIERGEWRLRIPGEAPRSICVADPATLLQLRHSHAACSRLVIANEAQQATVHYSCPTAGWGRTTVRVLTPRAITIDTQGIADNAPFAFSADAHRVGACPARPVRAAR